MNVLRSLVILFALTWAGSLSAVAQQTFTTVESVTTVTRTTSTYRIVGKDTLLLRQDVSTSTDRQGPVVMAAGAQSSVGASASSQTPVSNAGGAYGQSAEAFCLAMQNYASAMAQIAQQAKRETAPVVSSFFDVIQQTAAQLSVLADSVLTK